jgi:thioredoxin reductase
MPSQLRALADERKGDAGRVSHASRHADLSTFAGRSVAVIGAGQSALESAVLLREAGAEVHLLARRPYLLWGNPPVNPSGSLFRPMLKPESPLGPGWSLFMLSRAPELVACLPKSVRLFLTRTVLGPSGAWWLRNRLDQKINVALETVVEEATLSNDKVVLQLRTMAGARSTLAVDHVIAATGYRIDLDALRFLDPALRTAIARIAGTSAPRLSRSFESSVRGLYLTGLTAAPTFGTLMRFVCGTGFTARTIRRTLAR